MTDHPQEHASLDEFVAKVEASGEDRKHAPLGWVADYVLHHLARGDDASAWIVAKRDETEGYVFPVYTQQQLDDAVRAERERCILACIDVSNEHLGNANRSHEQAQYDARDYFQAKAHAAAKCAGAIKGLKP